MAVREKKKEALKAVYEKAQARFECQVCGTCCRGEGGIYLNQEEEKRIAEFLDLPVEDFLSTFLPGKEWSDLYSRSRNRRLLPFCGGRQVHHPSGQAHPLPPVAFF